ncbi:MAG: EamA family transporter, partial [Candidatus Eremiobacteraeota bacterium]|nr:EamA family transporter [Candidatus Eremiobacteraeota bacterium]
MRRRECSAIPYLILGAAQLAVGAAAIFARYALTGAAPLAIAATRLCIAALVLLALSLRSPSTWRLPSRETRILAWAGLALALHFGTWIASLQYVSVAISTLLVATTPIWTAAYDAIFRKRPLTRLACAAFVTGGIGVCAVVG